MAWLLLAPILERFRVFIDKLPPEIKEKKSRSHGAKFNIECLTQQALEIRHLDLKKSGDYCFVTKNGKTVKSHHPSGLDWAR